MIATRPLVKVTFGSVTTFQLTSLVQAVFAVSYLSGTVHVAHSTGAIYGNYYTFSMLLKAIIRG